MHCSFMHFFQFLQPFHPCGAYFSPFCGFCLASVQLLATRLLVDFWLMSSAGGLRSSSFPCQAFPPVSRLDDTQPHNISIPPDNSDGVSYGNDLKVLSTYQFEYGCSLRLGYSPPILFGYQCCYGSCSMIGIPNLCRLLWVLLGFVGGEIVAVVRDFIMLAGVSLLTCVCGMIWYRCITKKLLLALFPAARLHIVGRVSIWRSACRVPDVGQASYWAYVLVLVLVLDVFVSGEVDSLTTLFVLD